MIMKDTKGINELIVATKEGHWVLEDEVLDVENGRN